MHNPILDTLVRGGLLLALAGLMVLAFRRRPASLRALIWVSALGGLLLLPLLSHGLPAWQMAVLPASPRLERPALETPRTERPVSERPVARAPIDRSPAQTVAGGETGTELPQAEKSRTDRALGVISGPGRTGPGTLLLVLWAAGAFLLLARLVASSIRVGRLSRSAAPAGPGWNLLVRDVCRLLNITRRVEARVSAGVSVPAVAGIIHPVLLLPAEAVDWTAAERQSVVLHEVAHVKRWDGLAQMVGHLACAVYWFLPPVWYAAHRAAEERERACDDAVIRAGTRASEYASSLLRLVHASVAGPLLPTVLAMGTPARLKERVLGILDPAARREGLHPRSALGTLVLAGASVVLLATAHPVARAAAQSAGSAPVAHAGGAAAGAGAAGAGVSTGVSGGVASGRASASGGVVGSGGVSASSSSRAVVLQSGPDTSRFCGMTRSSSSSISDDGHVRKWTVKIDGNDCSVDLRAEGRIDFNDDFTDVKSMSSGGFFRLAVAQGGVRRELEILPSGSGLKRTWKVDGTERPWDAEAQAWFAGFLIELDRRTAIAVDTRLPRLLQQGGVAAVLTETGHMTSDYARGQYHSKLMAQRKLSADELSRLLTQAAAMGESDFYQAQVLKAATDQGALADPTTRSAAMAMLRKMDSDYYRAEIMEALLSRGQPTEAEVSAMMDVVGMMTSDYQKAEVLGSLLEDRSVTPAQRVAAARTASGMESDFYVAEVMKKLVARGPLTAEERAAFLEAVGHMSNDNYVAEVLAELMHPRLDARDLPTVLQAALKIESDFYRAQVLESVLDNSEPGEAALLQVVESAHAMSSDFYTAEVLSRVANTKGITDKVRQAVRDAAHSLGRFQEQQVREAMGERES